MTSIRRPPRAAVLLFLILAAGSAAAAPQGSYVAARLVAEDMSIRPGAPFWVAVRLVIDPEWHVYWKNPGDSGLATKVQWGLPPGFTAGPLLWPAPQRFRLAGEVTYGYEGEVLLLSRITPPAGLSGTAGISANVSWLVCKVECVPGSADLSLSLPVRQGPASIDPRWEGAFARARSTLPADDPAVRFAAEPGAGALTLRVDGLPLANGDQAYFFPEADGVVAASAPQDAKRSGNGFSLRLVRPENGPPIPERLGGVLVVSAGPEAAGGSAGLRAVSVSLSVPRGAAPAQASLPLLLAVLFAFVGGLILNLMPCVLPVLSLKVLGFVREAHSAPRRALAHGFVFTAGVVASFWVLLGALLALRAAGNLLGWGFQFQDPGVVTVMAVLVFVLGLNMFGVFEIGAGAAGVGAGLRGRGGMTGSFFTGVLATLVATPCTAPFMGSALGFALTQPAASAFLVFTALGVGMAAPSLVLSASPRLLARVPKPGKWMETLKQALAFLMVGTVVWLGFVLAALAGTGGLTFLLIALAMAALGAWIYGRWGGVDRKPAARVVAAVLGVLFVAGGLALAVPSAQGAGRDKSALAVSAPASARSGTPRGWEPFSPARLASLRAAGTPVFIDFGADWCLTCTVNERVALENPAVSRRFQELGVATLRADWTDRNDTIAQALAGYGRSGIPLYVLYGPGAAEPVLLPEVITPGVVLGALQSSVAAAGAPAKASAVSAPAPSGSSSEIDKAFSQ